MEVIAAKSAGFCFGVARAVKMAQDLAREADRPRMLGSVIHNRHVTATLEEQGMTFCGPTGRELRSGGSWRSAGLRWWTPPVPRWPMSKGWWRKRRRRAASR